MYNNKQMRLIEKYNDYLIYEYYGHYVIYDEQGNFYGTEDTPLAAKNDIKENNK